MCSEYIKTYTTSVRYGAISETVQRTARKKNSIFIRISCEMPTRICEHICTFLNVICSILFRFFFLSLVFLFGLLLYNLNHHNLTNQQEKVCFLKQNKKKSEKKSAFYVFPADINRLFSFSLRQIHPYAIHNYTYRTKAKQNTQRSMYIYPSSF